jgi:hypothetical protein
MARAILRYHKDRIVALCPIGHLITVVSLKPQEWAGSANEVEVSAHQEGRDNRFDRMAAKCQGHGH